MFFGLVTKHACDRRTNRQTDGHTDGQNYDSQDRASIAASCGKNQQSRILVHTTAFSLIFTTDADA